MYTKIHELAKQYEQDTADYLIKLINTPSFSGKEKDVINVIKELMEQIGFDEVKIDGLGNVIGRIGNGPRIMAFDAHIDTVYPGDLSQWDFPPFEGHIKDGKLWGRGSVDQKSGMASMLGAARLIKELGLNKDWTVYFTGTVMEEDCDGLCWQYIVKEDKIVPEFVVITEPTNLNLYRGHRGRMEMEVKVKGVSCHGSAPERGDNAIYKIARIALEIEKLNERLLKHDFLGKGTVVVSQVASNGPSQCAVPDQASLYLDRRLTWGETMDSAVEEIRQCAIAAGYPDAEITVPLYEEPAFTGLVYPTQKYYPTWLYEENHPVVAAAVRAYKETLGKDAFVDKWTFSTNGVAISGMHHIPCIGMGPGNEVYAHAANEALPVWHLSEAAAFYAGLVYLQNL